MQKRNEEEREGGGEEGRGKRREWGRERGGGDKVIKTRKSHEKEINLIPNRSFYIYKPI